MITPEDVEARNYSFASAQYGNPLHWETFIVPSPYKSVAREQAMAYATKRWGRPFGIHVYPRNYVVDARRCLAEGRAA